jgi:anti-sigma factor RsiW
MNCQQFLKAIHEYVDGEIDPSLCEQVEEHLADCKPCRVVVDTIRKTITLYKGEEVYEMPIPFKRKLHETLRAQWKQTMEQPESGGDETET